MSDKQIKKAIEKAAGAIMQQGGYATAGFNKGTGKGKGKGGAGGNKKDADGDLLCNYCGKPRRLEKDCLKKAADIRAGKLNPDGSRKQGGSSKATGYRSPTKATGSSRHTSPMHLLQKDKSQVG